MIFEELYDQYKGLVFNLALQYVQNVEDAEEITQDVFLTLYEKLDTFRNEANHSTWIYRITINRCLDQIKSKKRQKRFAFITSIFSKDGYSVKHDHPEFDHPGVKLEQKEELQKIFSLINELSDNQKTALILMKIEGKSHRETELIMGLSTKAVESLLQRAKNNLSKKLNSSEGK